MDAVNFVDYRDYLNKELALRLNKNPNYSLRSFAILLQLSPSHLSRVLNGQNKLSLAKASVISLKLKHNKENMAHFSDLVQLEHVTSNDQESKTEIINRIAKRTRGLEHKLLTIEYFTVVSEWYHFAILALTKTKGFKSSPIWISNRLSISPTEAMLAVERLLRIELLKKIGGNLVAVEDANITTTDDISSIAIKNNHAQHLKKAIIALNTQDVLEREFNNYTLCVNKMNIPKLKKRIRKIFYELCNEIDENSGDELYQLNVQFLRLSENTPSRHH